MPGSHASDHHPAGRNSRIRMRVLDLLDAVRDVIVLADGDDPARRRHGTALGVEAPGPSRSDRSPAREWISKTCSWAAPPESRGRAVTGQHLVAAASTRPRTTRSLEGLVERTATDPAPLCARCSEPLARLKRDNRATFEGLRAS